MNFTQLLHRNVQQRPDQEAVCYQGQSWSYRELSERVARLAGALQTLGVDPGDRVSLLSMNSSRYPELLKSLPLVAQEVLSTELQMKSEQQ